MKDLIFQMTPTATRCVVSLPAVLTSRVMEIDFHIAAPSEEAAREIAVAAGKQAFGTKYTADQEGGKWTCSCSRVMLLEYEVLIRIQGARFTQPSVWRLRGWLGYFGNA